jgi:hypothetical protein
MSRTLRMGLGRIVAPARTRDIRWAAKAAVVAAKEVKAIGRELRVAIVGTARGDDQGVADHG